MKTPKAQPGKLAKARAVYRSGRLRDAAGLVDKILRKTPNDPDALELMAEIALRTGDTANSITLLERAAKTRPNSFSIRNKLGVAYALARRLPAAVKALRSAVEINPRHLPAQLDLCKAYRDMGQLDESIAVGRQAIALAPDDPRAFSALALTYERLGQHHRAHPNYVRAAELAPDDIQRQFACGVSHLSIGDKQAARERFEFVIGRQADHAQSHWMLSRLQRYTPDDNDVLARLEGLLRQSANDRNRQLYLHFALGKYHADCGHYDQAFEHFAAGNRIEDDRQTYDPDSYKKHIEHLIETFSADLFERLRAYGSDSQQPLFIVGMPRSGTTLCEQILASHAQVFGAGELSWFIQTEHNLQEFLGARSKYPDCLEDLDKKHIDLLTDKYLRYIAAVSEQGDARYITDKMPANFERIGLIKLLFPKARIVHCRRNPLDNAVSQFTLLFQGDMTYSHELYNLGRHYAAYNHLMDYWKQCFPRDIIDIQYENLVQDQETETRRLLEFLNLEWDPQCLKFFDSQRAVRTLSDVQVRQPMYSAAVDRWKHYEKHLAPLKRGLRDGGLAADAF